MFKPNKPQRFALVAAALVVGAGTASLVLNDGFHGMSWIGGVLITAFLSVLAMTGPEKGKLKTLIATGENPSTVHNNGTTPERAWVIKASNSAEGIGIEYSIMSKLFGKPQIDWKILNRNITNMDQRKVEHFVLSTKTGRKEIYFDISSFVGRNKTINDGVPLSLHDPIFNRIVTITFLPRAAFDLQNFIKEVDGNSNVHDFLDPLDISKINDGFDIRRRGKDKHEIIIDLPQMTAIKLGVLLDLIRKDTDDLEVQDWIDNCTGAIRYALRAS
jgi:hypothetical protein